MKHEPPKNTLSPNISLEPGNTYRIYLITICYYFFWPYIPNLRGFIDLVINCLTLQDIRLIHVWYNHILRVIWHCMANYEWKIVWSLQYLTGVLIEMVHRSLYIRAVSFSTINFAGLKPHDAFYGSVNSEVTLLDTFIEHVIYVALCLWWVHEFMVMQKFIYTFPKLLSNAYYQMYPLPWNIRAINKRWPPADMI